MDVTKYAIAFVAGFPVLVVSNLAKAAVVLTGGTYTESFSGLTVPSPTPFSGTIGTQAAVPGAPGFQATKNAGNATALPYSDNTGTGNGGSLYRYHSSGSTDYALGSLASVSQVPTFGASFTNGTSQSNLTGLTLTYRGEQYRATTAIQNRLAFAYGTSASGATETDYLTSTALTPLTSGDILALKFGIAVTTDGSIDGNAAGNFATYTVNLPVTLTPGQSLFIRFIDTDDAGNDQGLALDNFQITSTVQAVPEPLAAFGGLVMLGATLLPRWKAVG